MQFANLTELLPTTRESEKVEFHFWGPQEAKNMPK